MFRKYLERKISESSIKLLAQAVIEGGDGLGTYYLLSVQEVFFNDQNVSRFVCIKAALMNFLQLDLKFVYYFRTVSEHFVIPHAIPLLLSRMNPSKQEVCYHSHLIGVGSKTRWLNVMSGAAMAAKSYIQKAI